MDEYLKITITASPDLHEILIAELSMHQYDSFQELDDELEAYIQEPQFDEKILDELLTKYQLSTGYKKEKLQNINWNEQWEKNFDPVYIEDQVQIRATFHQPKPGYKYDIIIDPKMSFGTGHHETTHLVVSEQLLIDHQDKSILDVGTGTGVLAIMAGKLGASHLVATDIDDWCIVNSRENFALNHIENYTIFQGTIDKLTLPQPFDVICANINKNVLLEELPYYEKLLNKDGMILLSGFYNHDLTDIKEKAESVGLKSFREKTRNNWALLSLKR